MEILTQERWAALARMAVLETGDTIVKIYERDFIMSCSGFGIRRSKTEMIIFKYSHGGQNPDYHYSFTYRKDQIGSDVITPRVLIYMREFWNVCAYYWEYGINEGID
jgi:hypothetical protein